MAHNNKIINKNNTNGISNTKDKLCNCHKELCSLYNQNIVSNIINRATVTSNKATKQYLGPTENISNKDKYKSLFNNINRRHTIELGNYTCKLKDKNIDYKIKLEILNRLKSKFSTNFSCRLYNLEKMKTC